MSAVSVMTAIMSIMRAVMSSVTVMSTVDALEGLLRALDPHLEVVQVAAVPVAYSAV